MPNTVSWSRGFFRLWLVIASAWFVIVVALSSGSIINPRPYMPDTGLMFDVVHLPPKEVSTYSTEFVEAELAARQGLLRQVRYEVGTSQLHIFFFATVSVPDADAAARYQLQRFTERLAAMERVARDQAIQMLFGLGLLPPAFLLGLGVVVSWILAGFRSSASE